MFTIGLLLGLVLGLGLGRLLMIAAGQTGDQ